MTPTTGSHYFDSAPEAASAPRTIRIVLPDLRLELTADSGVFSGTQLDPGTKVLLRGAPLPRTTGPVLDLGCGYGPIALTLATRLKQQRDASSGEHDAEEHEPASDVWAVDVNTRALELTELNAKALGLADTVRTALPDQVPEDLRFAAVYSNPPIRIGKAALHELLLRWLPRLLPDGSAFLVVQKNLGSDSLAAWLNEQGYPTRRLGSSNGYRILETSPKQS